MGVSREKMKTNEFKYQGGKANAKPINEGGEEGVLDASKKK